MGNRISGKHGPANETINNLFSGFSSFSSFCNAGLCILKDRVALPMKLSAATTEIVTAVNNAKAVVTVTLSGSFIHSLENLFKKIL